MAGRSSGLECITLIKLTFMTRIESERKHINASDKEVYAFMSDFNNFSGLMPPQVKNWESTVDSCSFTVEGMASLAMRITNRQAYQLVEMVSEGKSPFDFVLKCHFTSIDEKHCEAHLVFDAELNAFLSMVAVKPLTNLVNLLIDRLQAHFA